LNGILKNNLENSLQLGFGINTPPNPIAKSGWQLTFNDEFSGSTLDDTKWYKKYINQPNPFSDYQEYIDSGTIPKEYSDDSAIYVSGGSLKLSIEFDPKTFIVKDWNGPIINPATGSPFTVTIDRKIGSIVAKKTESWGDVHPFNQRFGFFEARCKIPSSKATWPAFWLTGFLDWPPEIDIFEIYTSKSNTAFESNYHWGKKDDCFEHSSDVKEHTVNNTSNEFHIYACEWDSCFIKWYYDNMLVRVAHNNVNHVFEPMVLILNNAIQKVPNYESELSLPTFFEIDYVRVYSK
jgi:beta-glucanase (GH16 family)